MFIENGEHVVDVTHKIDCELHGQVRLDDNTEHRSIVVRITK
jgi:hypothetical protein